jgi:hypothetical protein
MKRNLLYAFILLIVSGTISAQENYKDVSGKYVFTNENKHAVSLYSAKESSFKGKPKILFCSLAMGWGSLMCSRVLRLMAVPSTLRI